jgi:hypothetical protein
VNETRWTREIDGTTYTAVTTEVRPGIYEITDELLRQMLGELGWTEVTS